MPACAGMSGRGWSFNRDVGGLGRGEATVAAPLECQSSALGRDSGKCKKWIGGDRREQLGAKNFLAVIFADEIGDDVARDHIAAGAHAEPRLHLVLDQRFDLDDLAALDFGRHVDERARHHRFSTQAANVTITFTLSVQDDPSLSSAIAVTVWVSASRMRVLRLARPARGPR